MSDTFRPGEVTIRLVDEDVVLRPTPGALRALNKAYGGLTNVVQAIAQMRDDVMVDVIAAGTNATAEQRKALPDAVFAQGLFDLSPKLTRFVMCLGNGGRLPDGVADDEAPSEGNA